MQLCIRCQQRDVVHNSRKNKTMTQIQLKLQKFSN